MRALGWLLILTTSLKFCHNFPLAYINALISKNPPGGAQIVTIRNDVGPRVPQGVFLPTSWYRPGYKYLLLQLCNDLLTVSLECGYNVDMFTNEP